MALLFVRLQAKRDPEVLCETLDWALYDAKGNRQQGASDLSSSDFSLPLQMPEDYTTLVIVPAEDVLVTQVEVSAKQRRHLGKALPFLVEEVVAESIENMHLASGKASNNGLVEVLAASHLKMAAWLDCCRQIGLEPDWLVSETSAMPVDRGQWAICLDCDHSLIKVAHGPALKTDNRNLENMLELLLENSAIAPSGTVNLMVTRQASENCQAQISSVEARFENDGVGEVVKPETVDSIFDYLCQSLCRQFASGNRPVNLLQSPYSAPKKTGKDINWRLFAYVAAICVTLQFVFDMAMGLYLNHKAQRLDQEITQLYRSLFPGDKKIVNVKVQMENHLKQAKTSTDQGDFLQMMGIVGYQMKNMNRLQDMQIQQVRYDKAQLEMILDLNVRQVQQLDQFKQQLNGQGLAVTIMSASEDRQWVKGRLRISRET